MSEVLPTSLISRCSDAVVRAAVYIRTRQSPCGGFCFYRYGGVDEPSLGDTYYAVAALRHFGIEVPNSRKTANFVAQARIFGLTYLYFCSFTLEHIRSLSITAPAAASSVDASSRLESARKTIRLQQRFVSDSAGQGEKLAEILVPRAVQAENRYAPVAAFVADLMLRGGFDVRSNLWDTCLALSVGALLGLRPPEEMVAFIESLQHPPIGFLMTPSSRSPVRQQTAALLMVRMRYPTSVHPPSAQDPCDRGAGIDAPPQGMRYPSRTKSRWQRPDDTPLFEMRS